MQVSCQTGQDWPLLFRNDDNRPWYFRYWCEVNTGTPWKVMVSQSQTMHGNNQRISGFHGPAVCDLDNTPEVILSKCLIWGWLPPHIFLPICAQHVALFFPPSWKIRLSRSETVSITFWSNQERSSRLPLIWLDNLLWGLHKDTALITRICCTLSLYLGRPACLWCATRNRFVIKEFHGNLKLLSIIRSIWRLFKAVMEKKKGTMSVCCSTVDLG